MPLLCRITEDWLPFRAGLKPQQTAADNAIETDSFFGVLSGVIISVNLSQP